MHFYFFFVVGFAIPRTNSGKGFFVLFCFVLWGLLSRLGIGSRLRCYSAPRTRDTVACHLANQVPRGGFFLWAYVAVVVIGCDRMPLVFGISRSVRVLLLTGDHSK